MRQTRQPSQLHYTRVRTHAYAEHAVLTLVLSLSLSLCVCLSVCRRMMSELTGPQGPQGPPAGDVDLEGGAGQRVNFGGTTYSDGLPE